MTRPEKYIRFLRKLELQVRETNAKFKECVDFLANRRLAIFNVFEAEIRRKQSNSYTL